MPSPLREYRDYLYRKNRDSEGFADSRDSFAMVYLSTIPFLALEYFTEISYEMIPAGLVFPTGFLLFWAYYYTFYKPGYLEEKLSSGQGWSLTEIPLLLLGVFIWFVKSSILEVARLVGLGPKPVPVPKAPPSGYRETSGSGPKPKPKEEAPNYSFSKMPPEIVRALGTLNLPPNASWSDIRHRYHELAKKYHPDLHPDDTEFGNHFVRVDAAYRKLAAVRNIYFPDKLV